MVRRSYDVVMKKNRNTIDWENIRALEINVQPWSEFRCEIKNSAKIVRLENALAIYMQTDEVNPLARFKNMNDPVCNDSCMEFFLMPFAECDNRYINFEINPLGTMHIGIGENRYNRKLLEVDDCQLYFHFESIVASKGWTILYQIPYEFINECFNRDDFDQVKMAYANFYKCGEETKRPHYLCWNNIVSKKPDFHLSEFFGRLKCI